MNISYPTVQDQGNRVISLHLNPCERSTEQKMLRVVDWLRSAGILLRLKHINLDEDCLSEGRNKLKSWAGCILRSRDSSRALMWHFMTAHYCSDSCSRSALTSTLKEARRCRSNHGIIWLFVGNNNAKVQSALYVTSYCRNQHRRRFYAILSPRCPISLKRRVSSLWLCSLITTDKDYYSYESWQCTTRVVLPCLGFTNLKSQGPLFPVHWWLPNLIWLMAPNDLMERTHQNLKIQPEDIKCRPWVHGWNSPHRRRLLAGHSQR